MQILRNECKMCDLIPGSIDGLDTTKTGWHRGCYQRFTKNLDRLKVKPAVKSPVESPLSSPRKLAPKRSLGKSAFLFPANECLFCDKNTI